LEHFILMYENITVKSAEIVLRRVEGAKRE
jgi:hypothetical protein